MAAGHPFGLGARSVLAYPPVQVKFLGPGLGLGMWLHYHKFLWLLLNTRAGAGKGGARRGLKVSNGR